MTNAEDERERLGRLYAAMSDSELERIAADAANLTATARAVLEEEIRRRGDAVQQIEDGPSALEKEENDELVTIRQFRDLHEALLARGRLESAGMECFMADDNMVRMDWFISNLLGGVKIQVRREDVDAALDVLEQGIPEGFDVEGVGKYEQPRCPQCGSLDISFEEYEKGASLIAAWIAAPIPIPRKKWRCHSCGHTWREPMDTSE